MNDKVLMHIIILSKTFKIIGWTSTTDNDLVKLIQNGHHSKSTLANTRMSLNLFYRH